MIEDISERKEVERLKDELVSVVGHELRTPLTSIRGSLGLLEAGVAGELPDEARDMVTIARENTERLARLVDDTLDLERLQAGRVDVDARPIQPAELLAHTAQVVQPVADAAGVELSWEAPADLELIADPDRIVQTLVNLVANAVKFSPAGLVRDAPASRAASGEALISVADEGRGIPADQLERDLRALPPGRRVRPSREGRHRPRAGDQHARSSSSTAAGSGPRACSARARPSASRCRCTSSRAPVAVYDRRAPQRDELARAVRRHGRRVLAFDAPGGAAAATDETFEAVLVAGAGLEDVDPGVPGARRRGRRPRGRASARSLSGR